MTEKYEFLADDFEFVSENKDDIKDVVMPAKPFWKDSIGRFIKNKGSVIGIIFIAVYILLAIVVPMIHHLLILSLMQRIFLVLITSDVIYLYVCGVVLVFH
mgnify:CR=1 FL=1